jgi:glutaredoxin-related protein
MLDIYFERNQSRPDLQLNSQNFGQYWDCLQEFQSITGVNFDFYSDFLLNPNQVKIMITLLDKKNIFNDEKNNELIKFYALLWKSVAENRMLHFVGD